MTPLNFSTNNFEDHYKTEVTEKTEDEQYEQASENSDFVFGNFNFDDSFSKSIEDEVEEEKTDEEK